MSILKEEGAGGIPAHHLLATRMRRHDFDKFTEMKRMAYINVDPITKKVKEYKNLAESGRLM